MRKKKASLKGVDMVAESKMEKTTIEYKRNALVNLLEGYRKANQIIRTEKKRRLARLTKEDSFQEYDALCRMWDSVKRESSEKLEEQKTLFLIKRRQLFNKAGKVRKK